MCGSISWITIHFHWVNQAENNECYISTGENEQFVRLFQSTSIIQAHKKRANIDDY